MKAQDKTKVIEKIRGLLKNKNKNKKKIKKKLVSSDSDEDFDIKEEVKV